MLTIPFDSTQPRQTLQVDLDSVVYQLTLDWNTRTESWTLSVADASAVAIVAGVRVGADYPMLRQYLHLDLPPGLLICLDTEGLVEDPTRFSLGARHKLVYIPLADVATFTAGT